MSHDATVRSSSHRSVLPARLQDCVITNDNDVFDEELVNFALFADHCPLTFEEAARDDGWIQAMD